METTGMPDIKVIKALADENRLAMMELLADGRERCACDLASSLGMSDALVSHHVGRLKQAGLVETRRSGRWLHVRAAEAPVRSLAERLSSLCCPPRSGCCGGEDGSDG